MMASNKKEIIEKVKELYEAYPYPIVAELRENRPAPFMRYHFNYALRRRGVNAIKPNSKIWVAGCGTRQAVNVAMDFSDAEVFATDLSEASIEVSRRAAKSLNLKNVEFKVGNLLDVPQKDAFDLVFCYGVLHHLPDPMEGFRALRSALKENGVLSCMVYNRIHRERNIRFQRALGCLHSSENIEEHVEFAKHLARVLQESTYFSPIHGLLKSLDPQKDLPAFTDTLVHPQEHVFDLTQLMNVLDASRFRFESWLYPGLWDLSSYIDDEEVLDSYKALSKVDQWFVVYHLLGERSPLFEFYAVPSSMEPMSEFTDEEILELKPLAYQGKRIFRNEEGKVCLERDEAPWILKDGMLNWSKGRGLSARTWNVPQEFEEILKLCDGARSVAQLLEALGSDRGGKNSLRLIRQLFSPDCQMLAPTNL